MDLALGIAEIDEQHDGIFALLKRMHATAAADWYTRYEQVSRLRELCILHFEVEESLMRIHGFPDLDLDLHAAEHREYGALLSELVVRSVRSPLGEGAIEFLETWWVAHITRHDRRYLDWFLRAPQAPIPIAPGIGVRPSSRRLGGPG